MFVYFVRSAIAGFLDVISSTPWHTLSDRFLFLLVCSYKGVLRTFSAGWGSVFLN
jgi:hypothetical protein